MLPPYLEWLEKCLPETTLDKLEKENNNDKEKDEEDHRVFGALGKELSIGMRAQVQHSRSRGGDDKYYSGCIRFLSKKHVSFDFDKSIRGEPLYKVFPSEVHPLPPGHGACTELNDYGVSAPGQFIDASRDARERELWDGGAIGKSGTKPLPQKGANAPSPTLDVAIP
jgi:hypothetical protein